MASAQKAIRDEIARREKELASLRQALAALTGGRVTIDKPPRTGRRRPKTAAARLLLSAKLKAAWKRRKAARQQK